MKRIWGLAAHLVGLVWSAGIVAAQPTNAAQAVVQPISYFKWAPDVNGFVTVAADTSGVYALNDC